MYILNPNVLKFIPKDTLFDMTDLIKLLQQNEKQIGVFPVSEKSWVVVDSGESINQISMYKIN